MNLGPAEVLTILVAVVIVAVVGAFLFWGNRPSPDRFAAANDLTLDDTTRPEVAAALRRTYRGRLIGGSGGFVVAVVLAAIGDTSVNFAGGLAAILAGTLVGIALAQFTRSPTAGTVRIASLDARDPDDYRPRGAKVTLAIATGVLLAYGVAFVAAGASGSSLVFAIAVPMLAVLIVVLGAWLQRRIVEHPRASNDADHARVDNAVRASAVRAVHHATIGIVLCGAAFLGVTGSSWTTTQVMAGNRVAFEVQGATNLSMTTDRVAPTDAPKTLIWWTDVDGARHSRSVPGLSGYQQTHDGILSFGGLLAVVTGIAALFEWRAAARAWREPGKRRRDAPGPEPLAPAGAAS